MSKLISPAEAGGATAGAPVIARRTILGALVSCGCLVALCRDARAAGDENDPKPSLKPGDRLALDSEGAPKPLRPEDLQPNKPLMGVYPVDPASGQFRKETRLNMLNLVKLSDVKGGESSGGVLAFSAICTHKGCSITSWENTKSHWRCFCHMSEFDATAGGEVIDGPAETGLPTVTLALDAEGFLTASATFNAEPGAAA